MKTNIISDGFHGTSVTSIPDAFFKRRIIFFTGNIDPATTEVLITQLLQLELSDAHKPITLLINSPGGDVDAGLAVVDIMRSLKSPLKTVCVGLTASMGSILFLQGAERICLPHSKLMIHDPAYGDRNISGVKPLQIEKDLTQLMAVRRQLAEIIAERTGNTVEAVLEKTKDDCYMTAQEAFDFGLATSIGSFRISDFASN